MRLFIYKVASYNVVNKIMLSVLDVIMGKIKLLIKNELLVTLSIILSNLVLNIFSL